MARNTEQLNWIPIKLTDVRLSKLYSDYKDAQKAANDARAAFEEEAVPKLQKLAPKGKEPVFSYRFGRLALAYREKDAKSESVPANALEL